MAGRDGAPRGRAGTVRRVIGKEATVDQLRKVLASIQTNLRGLNVSQRLLIASLAVIMVMALLVVSQYTGRAEMVELLPGGTPQDQRQAEMFLASTNVEYEPREGKVFVPVGAQRRVIAQLAEAGKLPSDSTLVFKNMFEKQSWTMSKTELDRVYKTALRNELGSVIAGFKDIKTAEVFVDAPEARNLGHSVRRPTATVSVTTDSGAALTQNTVDAIAATIAGAHAGLPIESVVVIDGTHNIQRRASGPDELISTTYLEQAARVEAQVHQKIREMLGYIPGVIVAVTANVDVTRISAQVQKALPLGEGSISVPRRESVSKTAQADASGAAEPGVRSNQAADVNRSGAGRGTRSEQSEEEIEYQNQIGTRTEQILDPRGAPKRIAVSILIPRGYIISMLLSAKAAAGGGEGAGPQAAVPVPAEQEIEDRFIRERARIEESIRPQVATIDEKNEVVPGEVQVSLIPVDVALPAPEAGGSGLMGGVGTGFLAGGAVVEKAVLGGLAVAALGMMLMMVRKAGRRAVLPTAEELVGIPPAIDPRSDVVGLADETETALAGIELGEDEIKSRKVLEQVTDMVKESPDAAAKLLNRWITLEQ